MTVRELVEGAPFLKNIQVIVRKNGDSSWIQGFRIGPDAKIYKREYRVEEREHNLISLERDYKLKEGEVIDITQEHFWSEHPCPMKVMCVSPTRAPKDVLDLVVCDYLPRHFSEYDALDFDLDIDCYPPEHQEKLAVYRKVKEDTNTDEQLKGQIWLDKSYTNGCRFCFTHPIKRKEGKV